MKFLIPKIIVIIVSVLILFVLILAFSIKARDPYSLAKYHLGFDIPHTFIVQEIIDEWPLSITGDGQTSLIFSFSDNDENFLRKEIEGRGYQEIKNYIPEIKNECWISGYKIPCFQDGYVKLNRDSEDLIEDIIIDFTNNKLYIDYIQM